MFEKEVDTSTVSNNNPEQANASLEGRMFSFAPSRAKEFAQNDPEPEMDANRKYIEGLLRQNLKLHKQLQARDKEIERLKASIREKDCEIFYLQKSQRQLKKSLESIHIYNQKFISELEMKTKELDTLKNLQLSREVTSTNQIAKLRSKYEVMKQKYYSLKTESRQHSRNSPQRRPVSPKPGVLLNQIKQYVTQTKAKIRGESRNKDYFSHR